MMHWREIRFDEHGVPHPVWEDREETPEEIAARERFVNLLADLILKYGPRILASKKGTEGKDR